MFKSENLREELRFGLLFGSLFFLVFLYIFFFRGGINFFILGLSISFYVLSFFYPRSLSLPRKLWINLGDLLARFINPVVLTIIYLISIIPVSFFYKITNRDPLRLKINKQSDTYWIIRVEDDINLEEQF